MVSANEKGLNINNLFLRVSGIEWKIQIHRFHPVTPFSTLRTAKVPNKSWKDASRKHNKNILPLLSRRSIQLGTELCHFLRRNDTKRINT